MQQGTLLPPYAPTQQRADVGIRPYAERTVGHMDPALQ